MEFKDYYEILGVARDASADDIRRAYRKLARKYHPDVSTEADAEARMREINEAHTVLSDAEKRAAYDQLGAGYAQGGGFNPPPGWERGFEFRGGQAGPGGAQGDFSDFFSAFFGGMGGAGMGGHPRSAGGGFRTRGEDRHTVIEIDLDDALQGAQREIGLRAMQTDAHGQPSMQQRTLSVRIPAGVHEGQRIRLAGQGDPGLGGGPAGDLYLEIKFRPHARYRVEGRDLTMTVPIAPWEAALGADIEVPTPGGRVEVKVPEGTASGRRLRLRGRGIPGKPAGDLYLELQVVVPPADTPQARALYEQMARDLKFDPRARL